MSIEVRLLERQDASQLETFFQGIAEDDETTAYFHPHAFDADTARAICERQGADAYFAALEAGEIVGYGMLRGWDEGYDTPAFGVCVRADQRGKGIGAALLRYAIDLARVRRAPSIMLKVYEHNAPARRLYEGAGFVFAERTPDGAQLVGRLTLAEGAAE